MKPDVLLQELDPFIVGVFIAFMKFTFSGFGNVPDPIGIDRPVKAHIIEDVHRTESF